MRRRATTGTTGRIRERRSATARTGPRPIAMAIALAIALTASACSSGSEGSAGLDGSDTGDASAAESPELTSGEPESTRPADSPTTSTTIATTTTEPPLPVASLRTRIGPNRVVVLGADPGTTIVALDERGDEVGRDVVEASELDGGSAILRDLPPGATSLEVWDGDEPIARGPSIAIADSIPSAMTRSAMTRSGMAPSGMDDAVEDSALPELLSGAPSTPADGAPDQELTNGYNYIETRDGTTLSAYVSLPGPIADGPYPTLFEYSGYTPSDPGADDPSRFLIPTLGYALVQVNVRGTGCSGGSFDAFEPIQGLDGYDVIEVLADQPWVDGLGMWGVSYPGIMQLHVAATRPPSLDAIAPLSVIDRVESVLYPGGIFNSGFGADWTSEVSDSAVAGGQAWAARRIASGDERCADNQDLRVHNPDLIEVVRDNPFAGEFADTRSPATTAPNIDVPVFLAGAFHDEQTGGRFPAIIDDFTAAPVVRAYLYNGLHIDPLGPDILVPLIEFYDLYVADRSPGIDPITRLIAGAGLATVFGAPLDLPPNNYPGLSASEARDRYEDEPPVRVLFEVGATAPNLPVARFDVPLDDWPSSDVEVDRWYLIGGERLGPRPVSSRGEPSFETDPDEGDVVTAGSLTALWTNRPGWRWEPTDDSNRVTFTSGVVDEQLVLAGPASVDLWVTIDGDDADLEATLTEIAPDGSETYIQSGWVRLSRRTLSEEATELRPAISGLESDVARLSPDEEPVLVRIEILPFAHVMRDDSRLRLTVDTPGASRPRWRFEVLEESTTVTVHTGGAFDSSIALPVLPGVTAPAERPACGSLRGQPCRPG